MKKKHIKLNLNEKIDVSLIPGKVFDKESEDSQDKNIEEKSNA